MEKYKNVYTNPWIDETHDFYGCKEIPYLRISLMENDEIVYSFALDTISYYETCFGKQENYIKFDTYVINPKDYSILVSKQYQKYIIEIKQIMRSAETSENELIELPSKVFSNLELSYSVNATGDPASWRFEFNNNILA